MTIYQLINEQNNLTTIVKLIRNKIVLDSTVLTHISIYDKFYQIDGSKTERYNQLASEYRLHPDSVRKIIKKLNQPAK